MISGDAHNMPPAMILCGGEGTRLRDVTELLPKPMVPVGQQPIVWHLMKTYASFGISRFILCLGYKREIFIDYFLNYQARQTDITITLGKKDSIIYHTSHNEESWEVTLVNTGDRTMTGGRVAIASKYLHEDDNDFFLTYGDALSDVDIRKLYDYHCRTDKLLTITVVHPDGRFGEIGIANDGLVQTFEEKPKSPSGYINGGFMVLKKDFVPRYLTTDPALTFEQQPILSAVGDKQVAAFTHDGFWQCMDTLREYKLLNNLWEQANTPWTANWK